MLVKCMFSGSGGQGSALMAKLVCEGAMRENLKVVMTQTYGIEQRGGDSTAFIIISDEVIGSPIVENDATIAVALSQSIYEQCLHGVAPGGMLFTNASLVENPGTVEGFTQILLPVSEIAVEVGSVRSNTHPSSCPSHGKYTPSSSEFFQQMRDAGAEVHALLQRSPSCLSSTSKPSTLAMKPPGKGNKP